MCVPGEREMNTLGLHSTVRKTLHPVINFMSPKSDLYDH